MFIFLLFFASALFSQDLMAKDTPYNQAFISNLGSKPLMDTWGSGPVSVSSNGDFIFADHRGVQVFLYALNESNAVYRISAGTIEEEKFFTRNVFRGIVIKGGGLYVADVIKEPPLPEKKREDPAAWSNYIELCYAISNINFNSSFGEPWVFRKQEARKADTNAQTDAAFIANINKRKLRDWYGVETTILSNGDISLEGSRLGVLKFCFAYSPTEDVYQVSKEWAEDRQWRLIPRKEAATNWVLGLVLQPKGVKAAGALHNYKISRKDSLKPDFFRRYWEEAFSLENLNWKKLSEDTFFFEWKPEPAPSPKTDAAFLKKIQNRGWESIIGGKARLDTSGDIIFEEEGRALGRLNFVHAKSGSSALYKIDASYTQWQDFVTEDVYFGVTLKGGDLWFCRSRFLPQWPMDKNDGEAQSLYQMRRYAKENIDWKTTFNQPFLMRPQ